KTGTSARFFVENNIINNSITLLPQINLLDPDVPLSNKIGYTTAVLRDQVNTVQEFANDPIIEEEVKNKVAPIAAAVTSAALIPALSLLGFVHFLRYIFFQPLLLLGRRKRKGWGYVYNTLTRNPIDLALVRLVDTK